MAARYTTTDPTLNMTTRVTIRLSQHLAQELTTISKETGADRSLVMRAALQRMVDDYARKDEKQG